MTRSVLRGLRVLAGTAPAAVGVHGDDTVAVDSPTQADHYGLGVVLSWDVDGGASPSVEDLRRCPVCYRATGLSYLGRHL